MRRELSVFYDFLNSYNTLSFSFPIYSYIQHIHFRLNKVVEWAESYYQLVKTMLLIQERLDAGDAPNLYPELYLKILKNILYKDYFEKGTNFYLVSNPSPNSSSSSGAGSNSNCDECCTIS